MPSNKSLPAAHAENLAVYFAEFRQRLSDGGKILNSVLL
jgi:hypothetical protein